MSLLSVGFCAWLNDAPPDELGELNALPGYALQVLSIQNLNRTTVSVDRETNDRYCLTLSDGVHVVRAMLASQLNNLVHLGDMVKYAVVAIDKVHCIHVREMRLIIIHDLHVVSRYEELIGDPVPAPTALPLSFT